jgi:peptidyl-prolyl cis-trans isomerase C
MLCVRCPLGASVLVVWIAVGLAQAQPATQPAATTEPTPTTTRAADVAATVNGHPILVSAVEELLRQRTPKEVREHPDAESLLAQPRAMYLDMFVVDHLLDEEVAREKIQISDAEMAELIDGELRAYLSNSGLTRDEFDTQLLSQRNQTLEQFVANRVSDPAVRASHARKRLIEKRAPQVKEVGDDEIVQYYERRRERAYTRPEQVRVSHILVVTEDMTPEQKAEARKKAEHFLELARKPDADFAALASRYSECPSRAKGGDLGLTPRRGGLAEPLAAAAFALEIGQVSGIVEGPTGYHILKVTGRAEPRTIALEDARLGILEALRDQKIRAEMRRLSEELRAKAEIVYSPGWGPPSPAPGAVPAAVPVTPATTAPAAAPPAQ